MNSAGLNGSHRGGHIFALYRRDLTALARDNSRSREARGRNRSEVATSAVATD